MESVGENDSADEVRRKVKVVLIEEVSRLADYVRKACQANGYGQYASRYFSAARFVGLLESCDKRVIGALKAEKPSRQGRRRARRRREKTG